MFPTERVFYLTSKVAQEVYAAFACGRGDMRLTTLRVSSAYGPGQSSGALRTLACKMLCNEDVELANGGGFGADFVTCGDVSQALLIALRFGTAGAYNVGSGVRSTILDVSARLVHLTGADPGKIRIEERAMKTDQGFPALAIGKLEALGYRPTGLDEGLRDFVRWLRLEISGQAGPPVGDVRLD